MGLPAIRLTSVTYAIRAQKLLERQGIKSYIKKIAKNLGNQGCGYAVEVHGNLDRAIEIIGSSGIQITEIIGGE